MPGLGTFFFGRVRFRESEEYLEFQFKFLVVLLVSGALFTGFFIVATLTGANILPQAHVNSMIAFTSLAIVFWLVLRGRKRLFRPVAWGYEVICLFEYASALAFVPGDELRVLWFYINIPGVYILLGQRAGFAVTVVTIAGLMLGNAHLAAPYSQNAMVTGILSMIYLALFFHVYADRSVSYFTRMRESHERLHRMATHDTLTGVFNARAYYEVCDRMIRLAQRQRTPYAVLFVDLDHFKKINDTHGHAAGDIVLKAVAGCLAESIRKSDALGRIGGEEFSLFLPNTELAGALALAETVRQAIEALQPAIGEQRLRITASIGVARSQAGVDSMQAIQHAADQAMYRAKAGGRNRVSAFDEEAAQPPHAVAA